MENGFEVDVGFASFLAKPTFSDCTILYTLYLDE